MVKLFPFSDVGHPCGGPCWAQQWEEPNFGVLDLILCKPVILPKLGVSVRCPDSLVWTVAVANHLLRRANPESPKYQQLSRREQCCALWGWVMRVQEIIGCPVTRPSKKIMG